MIELLIFLAGIGAGALGALLGLGGGIFLVPFLNIVLGIPLAQAMAISLVTVIATSNFVSLASPGQKFANVRLALLLQLVSAAGAIGGTYVLDYISSRTREQIFGATALLVAAVIVSRLNQRNVLQGPIDDVGFLGGWFQDHDTGELVAYRLKRVPLAVGVAAGAGVVSTLAGIGGGVLVVPALNSWCGVPIRAAAATSSLMLGVTALVVATERFRNGQVSPELAAAAVLGVLAGTQAGLYFQQRSKARTHKLVMVGLLLAVAALYFSGLVRR